MPKVKLYNVAGQETGEIELNDSVFGVDYNEAVIHQAVVRQMANERLGTHATKDKRPRPRRRQEALETERHRPCQSRIHPLPTVGWRRHRIRTDPEKPCQGYAEKGSPAGCKVRTVRKTSC